MRNTYTVKNTRPINLNLFTIKFPIPAIVSILHRISGVLLFLLIPFLLWVLQASLMSADSFQSLRDMATSQTGKIIVLICLSPFFYHFVAGIRHLLMDMEIGVELRGGRISSVLTFLFTFLLLILTGIYLW
jgi:succinate dehydrogenase / fumarate reductase cytochrome b subunit